jgi:hypothetical protein
MATCCKKVNFIAEETGFYFSEVVLSIFLKLAETVRKDVGLTRGVFS